MKALVQITSTFVFLPTVTSGLAGDALTKASTSAAYRLDRRLHDVWWGVYVAHNGTRLSNGCSAANIAACFDIRFTNNTASWNVGANKSTAANWTHW